MAITAGKGCKNSFLTMQTRINLFDLTQAQKFLWPISNPAYSGDHDKENASENLKKDLAI